MLDHDSRDASRFVGVGRVEAPHLSRLGAVFEDLPRSRIAALHTERQPPAQRRPLRVADEPRREPALRQFRRNCRDDENMNY